jgi:hypothetical protein
VEIMIYFPQCGGTGEVIIYFSQCGPNNSVLDGGAGVGSPTIFYNFCREPFRVLNNLHWWGVFTLQLKLVKGTESQGC